MPYTTATIEPGDMVHARLSNDAGVAIQEFSVSEIVGTAYKGGPLDCDTEAGWSIELLSKNTANLNLPSTLSEITAYDLYDQPHHLIGKELQWSIFGSGQMYEVNQIFRWELGHI